MKVLPVVTLALCICLPVLGCKSTMGPTEREVIALACEAQCPVVYALAARGCDEIDAEKDPGLREVCFVQAEAIYDACPLLCGEIREDVEPGESG